MKTSPGYQTSFLTAQDHKEAFRRIKNFLAGRLIGATRERALLEEVLKCLFCKSYIQTHSNEFKSSKDALELSRQYREVFSELKKRLPFVFNNDDEIQLDPVSIQAIDTELQDVVLLDSKRDVFGDLYEVFIGTGIREEEGQFFTPQNGVELLISIVNPQPGERIIDPAAGAGGFLSSSFNHLVQQGTTPHKASASIFGVEKDCYLAKLTATRLSIRSLEQSKIYCGDSLSWTGQNDEEIPFGGEFDVVLMNPPFGKNIVSVNKEVQKTYDLGYDWKYNARENKHERNGRLLNNVPPQVLFVEKALSLLKEG
ncbi:class I SAM-dependent DNA methyltransferase, partial [Larkinella sp. C7]|uniref:HsdM family class I SAM-dependent methyltransferase n=1 Tax=Larkinella sp. C7 TaxID=2576607 RepID=UPI001486DA03